MQRALAFIMCWPVLVMLAFEPLQSAEAKTAQPDEASLSSESAALHTPMIAIDGERVWYIQKQPEPMRGYRVLYRASGESAAEVALILQEPPEAMIATDAQVYFIFAPFQSSDDASSTRRLVQTIRAVDDATGPRRFDPPDRGRVVASLPGEGVIRGVAFDKRRPVVLIATPDSRGRVGDGASTLQVRRLERGEWETIPLPDRLFEVGHPSAVRLISGARITILAENMASDPDPADRRESAGTVVFTFESDGQWRRSEIDTAYETIESGAAGDHQMTLALRANEPDCVRLIVVRGGQSYPLSEVTGVAENREVALYRDQPAIVERRRDGGPPTLLLLDLSTGQPYREIHLEEAPLIRREDFGAVILISGLLLAALVMFLFRPDPTSVQVALPANARLAEPSRRLFAQAIDLAPCALLVMVLLRVGATDLLHIPLVTREPEAAAPALLTILICVVYATIAEMTTSRTLGKWFLEMRVISIDGSKPNPMQVLIRNAMRAIALLIPPLVLFVLWNPYRQRLGDLAGRTVVIIDEPREPGDDEAGESAPDRPEADSHRTRPSDHEPGDIIDEDEERSA